MGRAAVRQGGGPAVPGLASCAYASETEHRHSVLQIGQIRQAMQEQALPQEEPERYQTNCSPTPELTSTSAPRASSSCAAAQSPLAAAKCSGERPRWSAGAASRLGSSEGVHASSSSSRLPGEGAERRKDSRGGQSGMQGLQAGTAGGKHNSSIWCS